MHVINYQKSHQFLPQAIIHQLSIDPVSSTSIITSVQIDFTASNNCFMSFLHRAIVVFDPLSSKKIAIRMRTRTRIRYIMVPETSQQLAFEPISVITHFIFV